MEWFIIANNDQMYGRPQTPNTRESLHSHKTAIIIAIRAGGKFNDTAKQDMHSNIWLAHVA